MKILPRVVRTLLSVSILGASLTACSSGSKADYSAFCKLAVEMQDASGGGSHGQDPAAITDPKKMEEAWTTISEIALKMRSGSPAEIKKDVATMVDSIVAMNKVFKANKYDLLAMSKKKAVREQLAKITGGSAVASASNRFMAFMKKNCKATS